MFDFYGDLVFIIFVDVVYMYVSILVVGVYCVKYYRFDDFVLSIF